MNKKYILIVVLFLLIPGISPLIAKEIPYKTFFELREKAGYKKALENLTSDISTEKDPAIIEAGLFLINEISNIPELYKPAMNSINKIEKNNALKKNILLFERLKLFKRHLLLRLGKFKKAEKLTRALGFIDFMITGPFPNRGEYDFSKKYEPEIKIDLDKEMQGSVHRTGWFKAPADLTGKISPGNFIENAENSIFYLFRELIINEDRPCIFSIGKTGFTDIWIDEKKVFSNREKHGFFHDQYRLNLYLTKGKHRILVKTSDNSGILNFSMRLSPKNKNTLEKFSPGAAFFNGLQKVINEKNPSEIQMFLKGFFLFSSNLSSNNPAPIVNILSRLNPDSIYTSRLCYYISLIQKKYEDRDFWLKKTLSINPDNLEALFELGLLKLNTSFFSDALEISERIKKEDPHSILYHILQAKIFIKREWISLAKKHINFLAGTGARYSSHFLELHASLSEKNNHEAAEALKKIIHTNKYNTNAVYELARIYKNSSSQHKLALLLQQYIPVFPDRIDLIHKLALANERLYNPEKALPYLSAAALRSPYNRQTFFQLGIIYHKLGRKKTALYYLNKAKHYNPEDYDLKKYIEIISSSPDDLKQFEHNESLISLNKKAEKFLNEPAVILLNENIYQINSDGSQIHKVRKVVKINKTSALNNFKNQYIVVSPQTDSIENLKCTVINKGQKIRIKDRYTKSLSQPESRLYYNLEAKIIPLSSLSPGSIIDFSYTIKKNYDPGFRNYSGDRITLKGTHRIIISNTVVIYQNQHPVYLFTKRLKNKNIDYFKLKDQTAARLKLKNIPPLKHETAMPHYSEILPCLYFTSHKNWKELYSWYYSLLDNRVRVSEEMKQALSTIINSKDSEIEKVRKIYRHVTNEIRYAGFELGIGGIRPRKTDSTYHTRMGDCKDISLVLVALLNYCGIHADLALIRTADKGKADLDVPYMGSFNHAICYVKTGKGKNMKEFFLDGTAKNTGFRELPPGDRHAFAFIINSKNYRFKKTDKSFYEKNSQSVINHITLQHNANAVLKRHLIKKGTTAASSRRELTQYKRKLKSLNEYWNKRFTGSRIENLKTSKIDNDLPSEYSYTVIIPSFAQREGNIMIFKPFLMTSNYYDHYAIRKKRKYPINISYTGETRVTIDYLMPEGFTISHLPKNEKFIHPDFSAVFNYTLKGNKIRAVSSLEITTPAIKKRDYSRFRDFTLFINRKEMERIVIIEK